MKEAANSVVVAAAVVVVDQGVARRKTAHVVGNPPRHTPPLLPETSAPHK